MFCALSSEVYLEPRFLKGTMQDMFLETLWYGTISKQSDKWFELLLCR
jgi:hypothetical protein